MSNNISTTRFDLSQLETEEIKSLKVYESQVKAMGENHSEETSRRVLDNTIARPEFLRKLSGKFGNEITQKIKNRSLEILEEEAVNARLLAEIKQEKNRLFGEQALRILKVEKEKMSVALIDSITKMILKSIKEFQDLCEDETVEYLKKHAAKKKELETIDDEEIKEDGKDFLKKSKTRYLATLEKHDTDYQEKLNNSLVDVYNYKPI